MWHHHRASRRAEQLQGKSPFGSPVDSYVDELSDFSDTFL